MMFSAGGLVRLHDEDVVPAHVLVDADEDLAVGEPLAGGLAERRFRAACAISSASGRLAVPDKSLKPVRGTASPSIARALKLGTVRGLAQLCSVDVRVSRGMTRIV